MKSLFGDDIPDEPQRLKTHKGKPAPAGTGPDGETCKTCRHYERVQYHDYVHLKCGLMQAYWTHGPGTDIKAGDAACKRWEAKP